MDRAGVDTEDDAIALAKEVSALAHLRLEGITGYEGHCSLEFDEQLLHRQATRGDGHVPPDRRAHGVPGDPLSGPLGGRHGHLEASRPSVPASPRSRPGRYVLMDNFHGHRVPGGFEHALTIATTVISRPPNRLIVDAGNKSIGVGGGPSLVGADLEVFRFDEEHGIFCRPPGYWSLAGRGAGCADPGLRAGDGEHVRQLLRRRRRPGGRRVAGLPAGPGPQRAHRTALTTSVPRRTPVM